MTNIIEFRPKNKEEKPQKLREILPFRLKWNRASDYEPYDFRGAINRAQMDREVMDRTIVHLSDLATGVARAMNYAEDMEAADELMHILQKIVADKCTMTYLFHIPEHLVGYLFWCELPPHQQINPTKAATMAYEKCFHNGMIGAERYYYVTRPILGDNSYQNTWVLKYPEAQYEP